ncbi:DUF1853 family protein [Vibrio algicola]|uniref:DUF1853 family protein n=1 Tax=Vibrio algicola TaxID=2662262 RepID=A0A5Q0THB2_9VIBR|nr:DUF1853 family protein [Vibrio algicola]
MPVTKNNNINHSQQQVFFNQISDWIARHPPIMQPDGHTLAALPFIAEQRTISLPYSGNARLGFWYQHLCLQHFQSHPDYHVVAEEIQLNQNGRTIGAIDFILEHIPSKTVEHWEVASKFYLLFDGLWYGPNSQDRLDLKLNHMLTHQLQMSQHPSFKAHHGKFNAPQFDHIKPKLLLQGRLYTNPFLAQTIPTTCLGHDIDASQINGHWCFYHQRDLIHESLYVLKKGQWLTGKDRESELLQQTNDQFVHCQSESGRFWFVLPDTWPHG